ncbi:AaceriAGR151Wp [[Ashbya] aceris (nom. inval.)]|nr:AaceriAGR151Wp [[Ashbya] aceris (nom. inval.)]
MGTCADHIVHYETIEELGRRIVVPFFHPTLLVLSEYFDNITNCFIKDIRQRLPLSQRIGHLYERQIPNKQLIVWYLNHPVRRVKVQGCVVGYGWHRQAGVDWMFLHIDDCTGLMWCQCEEELTGEAIALVGRTVAVSGYMNPTGRTDRPSELYLVVEQLEHVVGLESEIQFWEVTMLFRRQLSYVWELAPDLLDGLYNARRKAAAETEVGNATPCQKATSESDCGDRVASSKSLQHVEPIVEPAYVACTAESRASRTVTVRYTMNQYKDALLAYFFDCAAQPNVPYRRPLAEVLVLSQILHAVAIMRCKEHSAIAGGLEKTKVLLYDTVLAHFRTMGILSLEGGNQIHLHLLPVKEHISARFDTWLKLRVRAGKLLYEQVRKTCALPQLSAPFIVHLTKVLLRQHVSQRTELVDSWFLDAKPEEQGYLLVRFNYTNFSI